MRSRNLRSDGTPALPYLKLVLGLARHRDLAPHTQRVGCHLTCGSWKALWGCVVEHLKCSHHLTQRFPPKGGL